MRLFLVYSFLSMFWVTSFADVSKDIFTGIESNDLTTVEKAIKAGADVNKPEKNKFTPLGWAASKGNLAIMNLLINAGANINSVAGPFGASALTYAAGGSGPDNPDAVKLLLQHGAKVNFKDGSESTPLISALILGHVQSAKLLLRNGAEVNVIDRDGMSALRAAVGAKDVDIIKLLLQQKVDPNIRGRDGVTPLIAASVSSGTDVIRVLLENGADPKLKDADGNTALMYAKAMKNTEAIKLLSGLK